MILPDPYCEQEVVIVNATRPVGSHCLWSQIAETDAAIILWLQSVRVSGPDVYGQ